MTVSPCASFKEGKCEDNNFIIRMQISIFTEGQYEAFSSMIVENNRVEYVLVCVKSGQASKRKHVL